MTIIRSATPNDAARLLEIYGYYVEKTAISFELETPSAAEFRERIRKTLAKYPYLVAEEDGAIAGSTCIVMSLRSTAEEKVKV